jgi:hypothetical protein
MPADEVTAFLATQACAAIRIRTASELCGEALSNGDQRQLQTVLLDDPLVHKILASQTTDGWLGQRFHGYDSLESGIRILCEKGLDRHHPGLINALQAICDQGDRISAEMGSFGSFADSHRLGGTQLIRAVVLAYAGLTEHSLVQAQIEPVLAAFQAVLDYQQQADFLENFKNRWVLKSGCLLPGIYHLRLLAYTHNWRSEENQKLVARAIQRLVELAPLPPYYLRRSSQLIAPASYATLDYTFSNEMSADLWADWFLRMELLARMGILNAVPELQTQALILKTMLADNQGWFPLALRKSYFHLWGAYTGLALEADWRKASRRRNDLTFRSRLILHYAGLN